MIIDQLRALRVMRDAAEKAGAFMKQEQKAARHNVGRLQMSSKEAFAGSVTDLVGLCDREAERMIRHILHTEFPDIHIVGEEFGGDRGDVYFLVDPLDGTHKFSGLTLQWGVNIALVVNGEVIAGVIHAPRYNLTAGATKDHGLSLTSEIGVVPQLNGFIGKIIVENCIWADKSPLSGVFQYLAAKTVPGLAMQKTGPTSWRFAEMAYHPHLRAYVGDNLQDYDFAPGLLILRQQGFKMTDFKGREADLNCTSLIVAQPDLHAQLLKVMMAASEYTNEIEQLLASDVTHLKRLFTPTPA